MYTEDHNFESPAVLAPSRRILREADRLSRTASRLGLPTFSAGLMAAAEYDNLAPATRRFYRAAYRAAVEKGVLDGRVARPDVAGLLAVIDERIANAMLPVARRTSACKELQWTPGEVAQLIEALDLARVSGDVEWVLLYHIVSLGIHTGWRPSEPLGIEPAGCGLISIPTAKAGGARGRSSRRVLDVSRLGPAGERSVAGLIAALDGIRDAGDDPDRVLSRASARLARLSLALFERRFCLQALRHLAIAQWKDQGADALTRALLLGHASEDTVTRWYAKRCTGKLKLGQLLVVPVAIDIENDPVPLPAQEVTKDAAPIAQTPTLESTHANGAIFIAAPRRPMRPAAYLFSSASHQTQTSLRDGAGSADVGAFSSEIGVDDTTEESRGAMQLPCAEPDVERSGIREIFSPPGAASSLQTKGLPHRPQSTADVLHDFMASPESVS